MKDLSKREGSGGGGGEVGGVWCRQLRAYNEGGIGIEDEERQQ